MSLRVPAVLKAFRQPVRSAVSASMSSSGTVPQRALTAALSRRRLRGSEAASSGVRMIAPPFLRSLICSQSRAGSASLSAASSVSISSRSSPVNAAGSSGLRSA